MSIQQQLNIAYKELKAAEQVVANLEARLSTLLAMIKLEKEDN